MKDFDQGIVLKRVNLGNSEMTYSAIVGKKLIQKCFLGMHMVHVKMGNPTSNIINLLKFHCR